MRVGEDSGEAADAAVLAPVDTDWLRHTLTLSGPAAEVAAFQLRARGPTAIPWHLDLDHEEMRLMARELRAQLAVHQERVLTAAAQPGGGCPLDLHRLVPIPHHLLMLGSDAPASRLWLWVHWGTLQPLRHVRALEHVADARLKRVARVAWEFWSADWTPWRAIARLRQDWPDLMFDVRPHYENGAGG